MKKTIERRYAPTEFEVREAADGKIGFRGYAAVFNQVAYGEVIRPGAFDKTLAGQPDVRMLVNHAGVPIARTRSGTLRLSVDERGLLAEADELDMENPTVQELVSAMRRRDLDQMSFAFWSVLENRNDDGIRELLELGIHDGDVSVVTVPWYDETTAELNSLEQALLELRAGRQLTPELRAVVLERAGSTEPTVDADEDPAALAQAIDAVLDEVQEALATGDVEAATALVTAAEVSVDALLEAFGVPDEDDVDNGPAMVSAPNGLSLREMHVGGWLSLEDIERIERVA